MGAPSTAITRLDLSLTYTEFSLISNIKKFIGLLVLPGLGVEQEAAEFAKIKIASLLSKVEETKRAPKAEYARDSWEWTIDRYSLEEHGVEEVVDDATVERYGDIVRSEQVTAIRAIHRILLRLEYDIAAAVFNTTTWTGSALTTAVATPFTNKASCDPIAVMDAAHDKVNASCGEDANTLVITKKGLRAALRSDRLEGLLKYDASELMLAIQSGTNQKLVSQVMSGLKDVFNVEKIIVGRGFHNTADKGQTPSLSRVWDDTMAMLCCVHDDGFDGDLENPTPHIGRTLFSTKNGEPLPGADDSGEGSLIIEEYREERRRGGVLRPRNKRQVKIVHPEAGHLLTGITA